MESWKNSNNEPDENGKVHLGMESNPSVQDLLTHFGEAWERATEGSLDGLENVYDLTRSMACHVIECLLSCGLHEFNRLERKTQDLMLANSRIESMEHELIRLRNSEAKGREAISNLLKAVDTSKSIIREESHLTKSITSLQAELGLLRSAKNEALKEATEAKRKASLLADELKVTKAKLCRISHDKIKLELENRTAKSQAKSAVVDIYSTSECEFYKRKAGVLSSHVQSLEAVLAEKNQEIEELRRQIERSLSQNRLASIRADQSSRKRRL